MIIDFCLNILTGLLQWFRGLLPDWSWHLPDSVRGFFGHMLAYDDYFPISETLSCLQAAATLFSVMIMYKLLVKLVDWITAVIP